MSDCLSCQLFLIDQRPKIHIWKHLATHQSRSAYLMSRELPTNVIPAFNLPKFSIMSEEYVLWMYIMATLGESFHCLSMCLVPNEFN